MATNHTENYQLNLWEPGDAFVREEFNENSQKIEAALVSHDAAIAQKADVTALSALTQTVAGKADITALNAEAAARAAKDTALDTAVQAAQAKAEEEHVYSGTFVGDGTVPRTITLPWEPKFMVLGGQIDEYTAFFILFQRYGYFYTRGSLGLLNAETDTPRIEGNKLIMNRGWGNTNGEIAYYTIFR